MSEFEPINSNQIDSDSEHEEEIDPLNPNQIVNKDKKKKKKNKSKNTKSTQSLVQSKPISAMGKLIAERKRLQEEENERIRKLEEEEERKIKEEEERLAEIKRKEEEDKERKRKAKQDKKEAQKKAGIYKTKAEKERDKKNQLRLEQLIKQGIITDDKKIIMKQTNINKIVSNESETESETESESESKNNKINETQNINLVGESNNFRCPIFTIMGHVDTGKTTLLDYLRKTSVQSHEAGGITQQIGATLLTSDIIIKQIKSIKSIKSIESTNSNVSDIKIPGLLLVDTPGHEAFKILRKLGSKLADIAIVIVDIMHGLEPQTLESINLLKESNSPFMFVLNKIDRLYGWKNDFANMGIEKQIESQDFNTREEFNSRYRQIQTQIMSQGINCELFWSNTSPTDTINIIPISGITGQGIPDLLSNIISYSQTTLKESLQWNNQTECIVMEITNTDGYGYTVDCILRNGQLSRGDWIIVSTTSGIQIKTQIKNILTIPANIDSKFISQSKYIQHLTIKGACQIKIVASNLESSQIGSSIILESNNVEQMNDLNHDDIKEDNGDKENDKNNILLDSQGICIFTSTRGSMESLIQFARTNPELISPIQISYTSIGNVNKKDLTKFHLANKESIPEYQCVLAFEVEIDKEATQYAKDNGITIFKDETIYRLFNQYRDFANKLYIDRKEQMRELTVFPCILKIIESNIFNKKNPLIMGVEVLEGTLHLGTPLIIESKIYIGKIVGIQVNKQDVKIGKKGQQICVKIDNQSNPGIMYGRHFTHKDLLYSNVSRASVDILKQYFKTDISKEDIGLLVKLKKMFGF